MHKCPRSSGPNYHLSYHISFIIHSAIMVKARAEKLGRLITSAFGAWWTLIRPIFFHIVCSHHYSRCLRHAEHSLAPAAPTFHFIFCYGRSAERVAGKIVSTEQSLGFFAFSSFIFLSFRPWQGSEVYRLRSQRLMDNFLAPPKPKFGFICNRDQLCTTVSLLSEHAPISRSALQHPHLLALLS